MCCKLFCLKNQRQGVGERKQPQKPVRDNLLERAVEVTVDLDLSVGEPSPDRLSPLAQAGLPAATPHHTTPASSAGSSSCPAPQAQRWKSLCLPHPGTAGWLAAATLPYAERWNHPAVPQKKLFAIAKSESVLWRCPFRSLWKQKQLSPKKKKKPTMSNWLCYLKGEVFASSEETAYPSCPVVLGRAPCPTSFLILVITAAAPQTHRHREPPSRHMCWSLAKYINLNNNLALELSWNFKIIKCSIIS